MTEEKRLGTRTSELDKNGKLLAGQEACVRLMYHIIDDSAALRFITTAPNGTSSTLVITTSDGSEGTTVLRIWLRYDT